MVEYQIAVSRADHYGPEADEQRSHAGVCRRLSPGRQYLAAVCALFILTSIVGACFAAIQIARSTAHDPAGTEACQRTYVASTLGESAEAVHEILICWDAEWNLGIPSPADRQ